LWKVLVCRYNILPLVRDTTALALVFPVTLTKESAVGLLRRLTGRSARRGPDSSHLAEFARTRRGVEAFVEPPTALTGHTMVLVASTGEWTRRRVPDERAARALCHELGIPVYRAGVVGYPARMREWNRRRAAGETGDTPADGDGAVTP
jgi:hypothetical protein